MLNVPQFVLHKLTCARCGGYLSTQPVMLNVKTDEQICGKCFKILPDDRKAECRREIGLEAISEVLVFPCRYNLQGCDFTFAWNAEDGHEAVCKYRYNTLPLEELTAFTGQHEENHKIYAKKAEVVPRKLINKNSDAYRRSIRNSVISTDSGITGIRQQALANELEVKIKCEYLENIYIIGESSLKLNMEISGKDDNKLLLNGDKTAINIEGLVSLKMSPEVTYCNINPKNDENSYETIGLKCNNCKSLVADEMYHCLFGHIACRRCKGNICLLCTTTISCESRSHCKNLARGCTQLLPSDDVKKHEIDCEFNDFACPVTKCNIVDTLEKLIRHCKTAHKDIFIFSNEAVVTLTNKDRDLYFYCHERLFSCKYYFDETWLEFVVKYIGCNDDAGKYKYEVKPLSDKFIGNCAKRAKCLGWNEVALEKAVTYELKKFSSKMNFDVNLCIMR